MASSTGLIMEKQTQQIQQQQQTLKCPRCESSNTKFCYYNNYSLSQPRHFCKACKRYWTRGGTLRNVPVGGGCRKNKRIKKPISAVDSTLPPSLVTNSNPNGLDLSSTSNHVNPLFYGLPNNPTELNLQYPRFNSSRVFDFQPHMNNLGLGFSSGFMDYNIQDTNSVVSSYPIYGSSTSAAVTNSTPTMTSLIASTLQQQKFMGFKPYEHMQLEESKNRLDWHNMEQIGSITDPSMLLNSTWLDPANNGSSVTSLI